MKKLARTKLHIYIFALILSHFCGKVDRDGWHCKIIPPLTSCLPNMRCKKQVHRLFENETRTGTGFYGTSLPYVYMDYMDSSFSIQCLNNSYIWLIHIPAALLCFTTESWTNAGECPSLDSDPGQRGKGYIGSRTVVINISP
jgi:hypothetical protein